MPLLGRRGAASAKGFGFTNLVSLGGPHWFMTQNRGTSNYLSIGGLTVDSAFNVYTNGFSMPSSNLQAFQIFKFDKTGTVQWQRNLSASNTAYVAQGGSITFDSSGNLYLTGISEVTGTGNYFLTLVKYDNSGTLLFQRQYNWGLDAGYSGVAMVDSSGNIYVVSKSNNLGGTIKIQKFDSSLVKQWERSYNDTFSPTINAGGFSLASSGNLYISGSGIAAPAYTNYPVLLKYNSSGVLQWQRNLTGASNSTYFSTGNAVDSSENVYVCGGIGNSSSSDTLIAKYNSSGTLQWQRQLAGASTSEAQGLALDSSNNVYISGKSGSTGFVVKYNSSGTIQWQRNISNGVNIIAGGMFVDANGDIYPSYSIYTGAYTPLIGKLPNDGSKTGTYTVGSQTITYAASSYTGSTPSLTETTPTLTDASSSSTVVTTTLTSGTTSYTTSLGTV